MLLRQWLNRPRDKFHAFSALPDRPLNASGHIHARAARQEIELLPHAPCDRAARAGSRPHAHVDVPSLGTNPSHVHELCGRDQSGDAGVAHTDRLEAPEVGRRLEGHVGERNDCIDTLNRSKIDAGQYRRRVLGEGGREGINVLGTHGHPGSRSVATPAFEVAVTRGKTGVQVERLEAAAGAGARVPVQRNEHGRAAHALDHTRGDDTHDARMPSITREHQSKLILARVGEVFVKRQRLAQDAIFDRSPPTVEPVKEFGEFVRLFRIVGHHQPQGGVGVLESPCGIEARTNPESDRASVDDPRINVGDA